MYYWEKTFYSSKEYGPWDQLLELGSSVFSFPFIFGDEKPEWGRRGAWNKDRGPTTDNALPGHMAPSSNSILSRELIS